MTCTQSHLTKNRIHRVKPIEDHFSFKIDILQDKHDKIIIISKEGHSDSLNKYDATYRWTTTCHTEQLAENHGHRFARESRN